MSSSKATQETGQNPKTALSSVVNAGYVRDSKAARAALAGYLVHPGVNPDDYIKNIIDAMVAVKDDPAVVSSKNPFLSLAIDGKAAVKDDAAVVSSKNPFLSFDDPLLILAAAVEKQNPQPEINESSYPGEQSQKPSLCDSPPKFSYENIGNRSQTTSKSSVPFKKRKHCSAMLPLVSKEEPQTAAVDGDHHDFMRIVEHVWMSNYEKLARYYEMHGHSNVLRSDPDKLLSGWVKRQRNNLKNKKLSPRKISLLNELDFVWDRIDGKWYKKFCQLVRFQKKFGHCYVTAKNDRSLAEWTQRQRRDFKNSEGKMTKERVRKLEGLEGWSWEKLYNNTLLEMGIIKK
jgi:hypothetical protein